MRTTAAPRHKGEWTDDNTFEAALFDGTSAAARTVHLHLMTRTLVIAHPSGGIVDRWALGSLKTVGPRLDDEIKLRSIERGTERLVVRDPGFIRAVARHLPDVDAPRRARRLAVKIVALAAATATAMAGLYVGLPAATRAVVPHLPTAWEVAWGEGLIDRFAPPHTRCTWDEGQAALDRLTARLAAHADLPVPIAVHVIRREEVNAFALPGGQVVLFEGLLGAAEGVEEVAGVLAHELAHVHHRHVVERLIEVAGIGVVISTLMGDVTLVSGVVAGLAATSYSRDKEREADAKAIEILTAAGIDGRGLVRFFERLDAQRGQLEAAVALMSTHPLSADRAATLGRLAQPGAPGLTGPDWRALQQICDG